MSFCISAHPSLFSTASTAQTRVILTANSLFFSKISQSEVCHVCFPVGNSNVLDILRWVKESRSDDPREVVAAMQKKKPKHRQSAVVPGFRCGDDAVLRESGDQQSCQVLQESMGVTSYDCTNVRIKEFVLSLLCDCMVAVRHVNGGCFLQLILG